MAGLPPSESASSTPPSPVRLIPHEVAQRNVSIGRFVFEGIRDAAGDVFFKQLSASNCSRFDATDGQHDGYLKQLGERMVGLVGSYNTIKPDPENAALINELNKIAPTVVIPQPESGIDDDLRNQLIALVACRKVAEGYVTKFFGSGTLDTFDGKTKVVEQLVRMVKGMSTNEEPTSMGKLGAQIVKEVREKTGAAPPTTA